MANTEYDVIPMLHGDGARIATALEQLASIKNRGYILYGFHFENDESDPSTKITYLEDAVGAVPAHMNYSNDYFDYGSWKNAFFMPRPCMVKSNGVVDYYLDENDYSKREDGGASDIGNVDYDGNAMMEWGKNGKRIWMKIVPDATGASVYICDTQIDSQFHDYSFINKNNVHMDHFYTPIYNGSIDSNGKMRSLSGKALSFGLSGSAEVTACTKNGDGWYTEVFADRMLINMLLVLISKTTDSKSAFGQGMISGGESAMKAYATGSLNKNGLFFGYSDGTHAVKTFGMENWWGCQWRRVAGLIQSAGKALYKMTQGTADGSTATDYNSNGNGYLTFTDNLQAENGYQKTQGFDGNVMLPTIGGGSSTTYMCTYYWINASAVCYALFGGYSGDGSYCSAFFLRLNTGFGAARWYFGAAPSLKQLA